jgi:molybdopterin molybdotransferase
LRKFISWKQSIELLKTLKVDGVVSERIPLQNSLDRILSEDIIAKENSPKHQTSALDGFAIKIIDQQSEFIQIAENDNPAGSSQIPTLENGIAIKTFTGSPMPFGSDTLVPIENVEVIENRLYIRQKVSIGNGVRPVGEVWKRDEVIISKGTKISPFEIGIMAELNIVSPKVAVKPKVSIFTTGDEVLLLGEEKSRESQIRSSNNYTLESLVFKNGGEAIQLGSVGDSKSEMLETFQNALKSSDLIVTTGGVSVGDYDFVRDIVEKLEFEILFHGVKIKPGQHILVAKKGEKVLLSLPGFAYSSTITAILYLLPLIRSRLGLEFQNTFTDAVLKEDFYKRSKKTEITACNLYFKDGSISVGFENKKIGTSAILRNMLDSPALLFSNENCGDKKAGEIVRVIIL